MIDKVAVLLLNLGGPDSIAAIKPFLLNLFSDREIIRLPLQPLLARVIAGSRSKKVASRYQAIGGGSPITKITNEQAGALESLLNTRMKEEEIEIKTYVGMRYWHPLIEETLERIIADDFNKLVVLSLFPHYSRATTGSCLNEFNLTLKKLKADIAVEIIDKWYDEPLYLDALAETVTEELARFSISDKQQLQILFSAHALPQDFVDQGDPYPEHLQATIDGVMRRVGDYNWSLAFQSRSGPVKWMEPQTDDAIIKLLAAGKGHILIVPISFVSDHIETLYEIDVMYKKLAEEHGAVEFRRTPSLNTRAPFIKALAGLVEERL